PTRFSSTIHMTFLTFGQDTTLVLKEIPQTGHVISSHCVTSTAPMPTGRRRKNTAFCRPTTTPPACLLNTRFISRITTVHAICLDLDERKTFRTEPMHQ